MSQSITIACDEVLNIATVNLFHQDIKAALSDADEIIFEAKNVERVDAASLQLFACLFNDSEKLGVSVKWHHPSKVLIDSAAVLGLSEVLNLS